MRRMLSAVLVVLMLIGHAAFAEETPTPEFAVGSEYVFGCYEQDNNADNGAEPIVWIVVRNDGDRVLLLSRDVLDRQPYATQKDSVSWEASHIRSWLNGEFLVAAFTEEEQAAILTADVSNAPEQGYAEWPSVEWGISQDKIFLLSVAELAGAYPEKNDRRAHATPYAKGHGANVFLSEHVDYWTRSWGNVPYDAGKVNIYGDFSTHVVTSEQGIRPALWLDITHPTEQFRTTVYAHACTLRDSGDYGAAIALFDGLGGYSDSAAQASACREADEQILHVGYHFTFGCYEQDGNADNGAEPIEWLVLANDGTRAMLISRYVLDWQPYATSTENVCWESSSIRTWLNNDFFYAAFSATEQAAIQATVVSNAGDQQHPDWTAATWADTTDMVFLLSYQEANTLLPKEAVIGVPTRYAVKQGAGVFMSVHTDQWLRSAGKVATDACKLNIYGDYVTRKVTDKQGVRPVIWLDLSYANEVFAKAQYATGCSLQANGQYLEAAEVFDSIGSYQDSMLRAQQCRYAQAEIEQEAGNYEAAIILFDQLGTYSDSYDREGECRYLLGIAQMQNQDYVAAMAIFRELGNYRDCMQLLKQCMEKLGIQIWYFTEEPVNTGHNNGYSRSDTINGSDVHFGWSLGSFFMSGFTRVTEGGGHPVFIKTLGDTVTLYFDLEQDIGLLDGNKALTISRDVNGYDEYFGVRKTNFGRGVLIVRYTNYQNAQVSPVIYTDYLAATDTYGADTRIVFYEEGDYEIALNYEIMNDGVIDGYSDYRILFRFSIRNGNCMVYPFDAVTGAELSNSAVAPNGFYLDLARSRYLDINVMRSVLIEGTAGLVEDTRFNRPAKDGDRYTQEGVYTITVSNRYTGETTTKIIFVGSQELLQKYIENGFVLP